MAHLHQMTHLSGDATTSRSFTSFTSKNRWSHKSSAPSLAQQHRRQFQVAASSADHATEIIDAVVSSTIEARPAQPIAEIAARAATAVPTPAPSTVGPLPPLPTAALLLGGLALAGYGVKKIFDTPSRTYDANVGQEYDAWTEEGVLEYYWGEHIHLGYYTEAERAKGYTKKNFIDAKYDFVEEMLQWSGADHPPKILDVGCGIGGTSRYLANKFPESKVTGITLSKNQVKRGTQLAAERGLNNVNFQVMDALAMEFPDNSFDLVWACESGEHMPDKTAYVNEMIRVLKPGGTLVIATWCQREETPQKPFSEDDKARLQFLYDEWAHPYFVSKEEYGRIAAKSGNMDDVVISDWTAPTVDSWRHSIWVGVWDPWIVVFKGPIIWYKTVREIVTLERMHRAFTDGLMEYGMIKAVKKAEGSSVEAKPVKVEVAA
jgi:MPBQ/MSBQ methyltransferase